jgi:sugar phosphate isomerase/epimerase
MQRREFFRLSGLGLSTAALVGCDTRNAVLKSDKKAVLNISCQEWRVPGETLNYKLDFMEAHDICGLEVGGKGLSKRVEEIQKALAGRPIRISAVCAGFEGVIISEQAAVRQQAMNSMKEILTAAGAVGAVGLIIVPAFNGQTKLGHKESRDLLVELLPELGDHAQKNNTRILLEPLNRKEAYFLRLVADAAAICRDVDHPGIACMGDFWHMTWEETSDLGAVISGGKYLRHMHIASRKQRNMPGEDEGDNYVDGFKGLKAIGYQDYVSMECGCAGDPDEAVPRAADLIREQWAIA